MSDASPDVTVEPTSERSEPPIAPSSDDPSETNVLDTEAVESMVSPPIGLAHPKPSSPMPILRPVLMKRSTRRLRMAQQKSRINGSFDPNAVELG